MTFVVLLDDETKTVERELNGIVVAGDAKQRQHLTGNDVLHSSGRTSRNTAKVAMMRPAAKVIFRACRVLPRITGRDCTLMNVDNSAKDKVICSIRLVSKSRERISIDGDLFRSFSGVHKG